MMNTPPTLAAMAMRMVMVVFAILPVEVALLLLLLAAEVWDASDRVLVTVTWAVEPCAATSEGAFWILSDCEVCWAGGVVVRVTVLEVPVVTDELEEVELEEDDELLEDDDDDDELELLDEVVEEEVVT
jgi:hypothetical protein